MNAKKILKMCEDDHLTNSEIFESVASYLMKKMKLIGGKSQSIGPLRVVGVDFNLGVVENFTESKKLAEQYLLSLAKIVKPSKLIEKDFSYLLEVYHPNYRQPSFRFKKNVFTIFCNIDIHGGWDDNACDINLVVNLSYAFEVLYGEKALGDYPEFASIEGLNVIYSVIDTIAKAIRLVPFGE